ncbi:MAG: YtxH domain-containing protein [Chloroflexia bacterium]
MGKLVRFIGSAAVGAALGMGAAVMFAPSSGKELQRMIQSRRDEAMSAARTQSATRERELRAEWESRVAASTSSERRSRAAKIAGAARHCRLRPP